MHLQNDPFEIIEHVWIPLSDGTRLSARITLPTGADETNQVPVILEYLPYRKNDLTAERDALMHPFFAEHGYASVRVDARGSGDSDGFLEDEYLPQEHADAVEAIAWLAVQPWCTGKVGMIGISWGGFNGLQLAAERPPQLFGVISIASTDDRYVDDVHYLGGTINAWDQLSWAATVTGMAALPPSKRVRDDWRETWFSRLEHLEPLSHPWMEHQTRDDYWKYGSVVEDYQAMQCPVFMVGGWNDAYRDSVFRVVEGYRGVSKGLLGPWGHTWPYQGAPGPAIDFLGLAVRWWDFCLKGIDNGIEHEPRMQFWMQDAMPVDIGGTDRPGEWIAYDTWPPLDTPTLLLYPGADGRLEAEPPTGILPTAAHRSDLIPSADRGRWCPGAFGLSDGDLPGDQRLEDEKSLFFASEPLHERQALLGIAEVELRVSADKPDAFLAVRIVDLTPDGVSSLVARGFLNLTHREGHEHPAPVEPGAWYDVTVPLRSNGYRFEPGHRIGLAIDTNYWPWAWPSPDSAAISIAPGEQSVLTIPLQPPAEVRPIDFGHPRTSTPRPKETIGEVVPANRTSHLNEESGIFEVFDTVASATERFLDDGIVHGMSGHTRYVIEEGDPLSARIECYRDFSFSEDAQPERTKVAVTSCLSSMADSFLLNTQVEAFEGNRRVFVRNWSRTVPRNHL